MSDSDEDEDLKRAIALSLQTKEKQEVISLDSDTSTTTDDEPVRDGDVPEQDPSPPSTLPILGILGLDRKAMERERLARKRKAPISPPPIQRKIPKTLPASNHDPQLSSPPLPQPFEPPYPNGTIKKTWSSSHPRHSDIKIEEVLQKNDLSLAVLSSFQWDIPWLFQKLNLPTTQVVLVMQAETDEVKAQYRQEVSTISPNLRLCFPSMKGQINCMHSKLMLLSYPTHLRVVVPTANLVPYDWGETGIMENMVFLIDLPRRLPLAASTSTKEMTPFGTSLIYFLTAQGLEDSIIKSLYNFDFSATKDLAFVHTIGGAHTGDSWRRTGYCGLGSAISQLGLATQEDLSVDYVTSSLGALTTDFLSTLYHAAQGDDGLAEYDQRTATGAKGSKNKKNNKDTASPNNPAADIHAKNFHIYFPSHTTILASTGGPENAGTICFQPKWYHAPSFLRSCLRDCKSTRRGMLMHNKLIFVRPASVAVTASSPSNSGGKKEGNREEKKKKKKEQEEENEEKDKEKMEMDKEKEEKGWLYIGSANCSESAWGRLVREKGSKQIKLNARNWEAGVLVPVRRMREMRALDQMERQGDGGVERDGEGVGGGKGGGEDVDGLKMFERLMPVPMEAPGEEYSEGMRPWFYSEGGGGGLIIEG
ncbi:MAG: hypothetical protein Q9220_006929 [cf. Caloplaca sp. 1 TL-2023]